MTGIDDLIARVADKTLAACLNRGRGSSTAETSEDVFGNVTLTP